MAKLNFALLCSRAIVDKETSQLSIIDVVEGVTIKAPAEAIKDTSTVYPLQIPLLLVLDVSRSQADVPETVQMRVRALAPNGTDFGGGELALELQGAVRGRGFMTVSNLPVSSEGTYIFDVKTLSSDGNWSTAAEVSFSVTISPG